MLHSVSCQCKPKLKPLLNPLSVSSCVYSLVSWYAPASWVPNSSLYGVYGTSNVPMEIEKISKMSHLIPGHDRVTELSKDLF